MAHSTDVDEVDEMKRVMSSENIHFVRVELPDTFGCSRGLHVSAPFFLKNYHNGFPKTQAVLTITPAGQFPPDTGFLDEISYRNGAIVPDISTFHILPWADRTASVIAVMHADSNSTSPPHPACSRSICKNQLLKLSSLGFEFYSAFEYEFYILKPDSNEPLRPTTNFLSVQEASHFTSIVNEIMEHLISVGINPEVFHAENGPSQLELTFSPSYGILNPDNAFMYKNLVKEIARKHGCVATFMSKPFQDGAGSAGHFNHSLWNINGGGNAFYDENMEHGMSRIARNWMAGLRYHSKTLHCLTSPTPNCFERTNVGGFAPVNNAWGLDNRSLAYRVKDHNTNNIYFENRLAPAGANPYLVMAGCIIAGMDGIKLGLELEGDPYEGEISTAVELPDHVHPLPQTLSESIEALEKNEVFVEALGGEFIKMYSAMKRCEDDMANKVKSDGGDVFQWYMKQYGEFL